MNNITIAFVGTISAGKTTLLNAIYNEQIGDTHTRKTTLVPNIFHESIENETRIDDTSYIIENSSRKNLEFIQKLETNSLEKLEEQHYNIKHIDDLILFEKNINLILYDIPGLNDSTTKSLYYKYMDNEFKNFDIIIWTVDVNSAINTSDEIDICNSLIKNIKNNYDEFSITTKLIVLINKCDDMQCDENNNMILDDEKLYMFNQAKKIIDDQINNKEIYHDFKYEILPISCENAYIYRSFQKNPNMNIASKYMNKLGHIECSRSEWNKMSAEEKKIKILEKLDNNGIKDRINDTGFNKLKTVLQGFFKNKKEIEFLLNRIKYNVIYRSKFIFSEKLVATNKIISEINHFENIKKNILNLSESYDLNASNKIKETFDVLYENLKKIIYTYKKYSDKFIKDNDIKDSVFANYEYILSTYSQFINIFGDVFRNELINDYMNVCKIINNYHINKIKNVDVIWDKLVFVDKLKNNNYIEWEKLIIHCVITSNCVKLTNEELIITIEKIREMYLLNNTNCIDLIFNIIDVIYANDFKSTNITKMLACEIFWSNIIIRSTNIYALPLFSLRKMLNHYNGFQNNVKRSNGSCNFSDSVSGSHSLIANTTIIRNTYKFELETYLYNILKTTYPSDFNTYDDILIG